MNAYERLHRILDTLRHDCPWDREQTHESLRYLTIEEVNELSEAILAQQHDEVRKELGDLFLHLLFYCKIAEDNGWFSLDDVLHGIGDKLLSRHPHIALPDREGCLQGGPQNPQPQWERIKMKEGRHSVLEGVPKSLPTLVKTVRMQEKASGYGIHIPAQELDLEPMTEEEYGDLLFALVHWGRLHGLNADDALARANQGFQRYVDSREREG